MRRQYASSSLSSLYTQDKKLRQQIDSNSKKFFASKDDAEKRKLNDKISSDTRKTMAISQAYSNKAEKKLVSYNKMNSSQLKSELNKVQSERDRLMKATTKVTSQAKSSIIDKYYGELISDLIYRIDRSK